MFTYLLLHNTGKNLFIFVRILLSCFQGISDRHEKSQAAGSLFSATNSSLLYFRIFHTKQKKYGVSKIQTLLFIYTKSFSDHRFRQT